MSTHENPTPGRSAGVLRILALALSVAAGCNDADDGPCAYEARSLLASDLTPWGTPVGDDIAALAGPYPGTWTWAPSTEEIAIEDAGQTIAVEAVFEVDETSYRLREHVAGGAGVYCNYQTIQADGVLSFRDLDGVVVAAMPVTVERSLGETPFYVVFEIISPVSAFSTGLTELSGFEDTAIRVLANWGLEGESLGVNFDYIGLELDDSGGVGFIVDVADFE